MELSPSDKGRIEHQFDSFCKLVLVCEMKDYKKMILRKMAKEILFSELLVKNFRVWMNIKKKGILNDYWKT